VTALYTTLVLDHQRSPRHFGTLARYTHASDGANPLCGDALRVEVDLREGRIHDLRFHGASCAVATASASMLGERLHGKPAAELAAIEERFAALVEGAVESDPALGDLNAFAALARHPARRKCALLAFATLRAALAGDASATTEG
jgi:nitrogen fixation NifU-like protein